jgi:hypothetical protein
MLLAVATPVGMIILSSGAHNVLLPRSLSASLPAAVLLVAVVLSAPRAPVGAILIGVSLMILAVSTVRSLRDPPRDNGFRQAADYIEARSGPADGVVYASLYHHPPHPLAAFLGSYLSDDAIPVGDLDLNDRPAWRRAAHGGRVFLVLQPIVVFGQPLDLERRAGPGRCFGLRQRKVISRSPPLLLGVYTVRPGGTLCARLALLGNALDRSPVRLSGRSGMRSIAPWFGHRLPVDPRTVKGAVHRMSTTHGRLVVEGAVDPRDAVPTWVVVFRGRHLVAAGVPDSRRPDLLKARNLPVNAIHFRVSGRPASPLERADTQHLKVFAIGPHRAFALGR